MRSLSQIILLLTFTVGLYAQSPHGKELTLACEDCHNSKGWKLEPGTYTFSHDNTQFPLLGLHQDVNCRLCHPALVFSDAETECVSCHTDMHYQTVGLECARCHTPKSWLVENINDIHRQSRFPLVGPHQTADCYSCHPSASLLKFDPQGIECYDCHRQDYEATVNPNHIQGNYSTDCIECHKMNSFTWSGSGIEHSFFPLTEGHAISDCKQCHTGDNYSYISPDCITCHQPDYNTTENPNHLAANISTNCAQCHSTQPGWKPASFQQHDAQFFPVYSGSHAGTWANCTDCHTNPNNFTTNTCIVCHEHNQAEMDDEHDEVGGYVYSDPACLECHPTGEADDNSFNHNLSNFPLTGAHITTGCLECHANGYAGTTTICEDCHIDDYNQSANPNHGEIGLITDCALCHSTTPEWKPATFDMHNDYYLLTGAHAAISGDCFSCHAGEYYNTPTVCNGCHAEEYNQTIDPPHQSAQFPTDCETCHTQTAWVPSVFEHDGQYFPIFSGEHEGEWNQCSDCHTNPSNYLIFTCITCHEPGETNEEHQGISGYQYNSDACFACHPDGSGAGGFNHNATNFPLTGAHTTVDCNLCHENGYSGTSTICSDCHQDDFNQSTNPNHNAIGLTNDCETCHTTNPDWQPAAFPVHNSYYLLAGAHVAIANDCSVCHNGNYNSTPNTCYGCHTSDYNQTNDPPHQSAQFPTDCELCHSQSVWVPSTFDHDGQYFPIYSGEHEGEWNQCSDCHTNPGNYAIFSCFACHLQGEMDDEHEDVPGYQYNSEACLTCHPDGGTVKRMIKQF